MLALYNYSNNVGMYVYMYIYAYIYNFNNLYIMLYKNNERDRAILLLISTKKSTSLNWFNYPQ